MTIRVSLRAVALAGVALLLTTVSALANDAMFPFPIQTTNTKHDATDMSWLNECPAGKHGFVTAKGGHFVDGTGKRIRFLGVNVCMSAAFPDHPEADILAARLAKLGVNCVRMHWMDGVASPKGIWDPAYPHQWRLDPGQMDKLDYLIARFKQHGIYVDMNLHVARAFSKADGFPDADKLTKYDKGVDNFEPRMIELQKNYARDLLTHLNPYTKTRYVDEPAVAIVEINNEDSLLIYCMEGVIDTIPDYYKSELAKMWSAWLKTRYSSTAELRKAWGGEPEPIGDNILANADLSAGTGHWTLEAPSPAKASLEVADTGPEPGTKCLHATLTHEGTQPWHFQVHQLGLDLTDGKPYVLRFWARSDQPRKIDVNVMLDKDPWRSVGFARVVDLQTKWQHYEYHFIANKPEKNHTRVSFNLQNFLGEVWIAGVELNPGGGGGLPASSSLEAGNIDLPGDAFTPPQRADFLVFAAETERSYALDMRDYVKKTLGSKSLVIDTQMNYGGIGGLYRESLLDFGDMHAYWQHPSFPNKPWDPANWRVANTPMVRALGQDRLTTMAMCRLADKPFTLTEYNHAAPNDYSGECMPMSAAFAAQQDWDGIFYFDYRASNEDWNRDHISGYFDIDSHPAKITLLPAAAAIFRRADVAPLPASTAMEFPIPLIPDDMREHGNAVPRAWEACGFTRTESLTSRIAVRLTGKGDKPVVKRGHGDPPLRSGRSPLRPSAAPSVTWTCETGKEQDATFTINSPASRGLVGFASGRKIKLAGLTIEPTGGPGSFAAITVIALDGKPLERSAHLLISAVGRVENTGMVWNADRTSVGKDWGTGPVLAEGIAARITLDCKVKRAQVFALDGGGGRAGSVTCDTTAGKLAINLGAQWKTLWYAVVIER